MIEHAHRKRYLSVRSDPSTKPELFGVSRGNAAAIKYVDSLPEPWALSQVTAIELIVGARDKRELATIDSFLALYPFVPLSDSIGTGAYRLLENLRKIARLHAFRFGRRSHRDRECAYSGHTQSKENTIR